ncbi:hypothetical protein COMA2_110012 [Candidatus Nitrospira nitrificans]|uniref:Transposase InsH N-terminal domain-containing protein n=1 Tax=Candidatus Nitrospira nitrificans TaxID=1742973 RepID=A0A0S4L4R6_9BACT|nr:hypothetical protein COMA2_110012 [Candidatus Nitrospira nitrificans]
MRWITLLVQRTTPRLGGRRQIARRERFLDESNRVVPWTDLVATIAPVSPKAEGPGRPPVGIERMLRHHCLQQWFTLSDPTMEEALYDSRAMRQFVGIDLVCEPVPDETTICKFRQLLGSPPAGRTTLCANPRAFGQARLAGEPRTHHGGRHRCPELYPDESLSPSALERGRACPQSHEVEGPRQSRACVLGDQADRWMGQSPVPWVGEEYPLTVHQLEAWRICTWLACA